MTLIWFSYLLLGLSLVAGVIGADKQSSKINIVTGGAGVAALIVAMIAGTVVIETGMFLALCLGVCSFIPRFENVWLRRSIILLMTFVALVLGFKLFPGITNSVWVESALVSLDQRPIRVAPGFDKGLSGVFCLLLLVAIRFQGFQVRNVWILFPIFLILQALIDLSVGMSIDLKLPEVTLAFLTTNLIFTCITEEAFFRGLVQGSLADRLSRYRFGSYAAIFIASVVFGAAHFAGGIQYVLLASVAGLWIGVIYHFTQKLWAAILIHILINMTHFLFITYPSPV